MRVKTLICNCKGLSTSFENADMNTLPFKIESELDVDYAIVHPQLCGIAGNKVLEDVLRSADDEPDTLVIVGACGPDAQLRLFERVLRKTGFPQGSFLAVDVRDATNEGILARLRDKIEKSACPDEKRR